MEPPLSSLLFQVRTLSQGSRPPPGSPESLAAAGAGASPVEPPEMAWLARGAVHSVHLATGQGVSL